MAAITLPDIRHLLSLKPSSPELLNYISTLVTVSGASVIEPEIKSYPDAVYFNYFKLGLSLLFTPTSGYKPKMNLSRAELQDDGLILDGIDLYNVPTSSNGKTKSAILAYSTFPLTPLAITLTPGIVGDKPRPDVLEITPVTTGKDFVGALGEPARKGGGAGPSSGSIGIWCEWAADGLMIEFGGDEARGPQAWERGKDAVWKVISIFPPKKD
jgi:hypothetical protein